VLPIVVPFGTTIPRPPLTAILLPVGLAVWINGLYAPLGCLFFRPNFLFITLVVLKKITGITTLSFFVPRTPLLASLAMGALLLAADLLLVFRLAPMQLFVAKVVKVYAGACWFAFHRDVLETLRTIRGLRLMVAPGTTSRSELRAATGTCRIS